MTGVLLVAGAAKPSDGLVGGDARHHRHRDQDRPDHAAQRPASVFSLIGKTDLAYFKMINDKADQRPQAQPDHPRR